MTKGFPIEGQDVCPATIGGDNIYLGSIKDLSDIYLCGMLISTALHKGVKGTSRHYLNPQSLEVMIYE